MTRPSNIHPAIPAFTAGFRPRPMDKKSIREWIAKKAKVRRPSSIRRRLVFEIVRAETALIDLKPIKTHPNVGLARQNARAHLDWAKATKTELLRMYPKARRKFRPQNGSRRPNRLRVGTLQREAQVFKPRKPRSDT